MKYASVFKLLNTRFYLPILVTQFFGAFNDNAFKLAILTLISYHISQSQQQSEFYQALAGALFTLPFFLFSALAGQISDYVDKASLARWVKLGEVALMMLGGYALYIRSVPLMLTILAGMGTHSTFFGPIKYSILPQHLPEKRLLAATSMIEATTFIAILTGTVIGTLSVGQDHVMYAILLINVVAILGMLSSLFIPPAPSTDPDLIIDWFIPRATINMLRQIYKNKPVVPVIIAISWFWLFGAVVLIKLPDFTHYVLGADQQVFAIFLALFCIGIAMGSLSINFLQRGVINLRYVAGIMLGMSVFAVDLYYTSRHIQAGTSVRDVSKFIQETSSWRIFADFFFLSFTGGLYIPPLYAFLQVHGISGQKSRTIAANNIINAVFMVMGSFLVMGLLELNFTIPGVFFVMAVLNALMAIWLGLWFYLHIES